MDIKPDIKVDIKVYMLHSILRRRKSVTELRKYMHLERYGNTAVEGIEYGTCLIFPKIDGTNGSVWFEEGKGACAGSRNRVLSAESDNAGFFKAVQEDKDLCNFVETFRNLIVYGEWLVPHSLTTYRDDAWRKFYIFDVYCKEQERYLSFDEYRNLTEEFKLTLIEPLCQITNPTYEDLIKALPKNTFLIKDGEGAGEGIVIKNYNYKNKFGYVVFAKLVSTVFKELNCKKMGYPAQKGTLITEQRVVRESIDKVLVDKVVAKIILDEEGWSSKSIPRLLNTVYYELVTEELWNVLKKFTDPTINFRTLKTFTFEKVKELRADLF